MYHVVFSTRVVTKKDLFFIQLCDNEKHGGEGASRDGDFNCKVNEH